MRISTSQMFSSSVAGYSKGYADIVKTQQQISSGVRIQTPADDPVGAARLLQLEQQQTRLTQYSGNMTSATNALSQQESVLSTITNVLQRARELAVGAGDGSLTDEDRSAIADELGEIEDQLLSLMNSKDANGNYLFSGSEGGTQPFVKNPDGSYSYQGDQSALSVQVSDTLNLVVSDSGWSVFGSASNADRTESSLTTDPNSDGIQRVYLSQGTVTSEKSYNSSFREGSPYTLNVVSSTQFQILDSDGNDVTSEVTGSGTYDATSEDGVTITFRGVDITLDVALTSTDDTTDMDALVSGYSFSFGVQADTFSVNRSATNSSTAQISGGTISDATAYATSFPDNGVLVKFTSATAYEVYALPTSSGSTAISSGTLSGSYPDTITIGGVDFSISSAAATGDQFSLTSSSHETQSILDTIANLRTALSTSTEGDTQAQLNISDAVASALTNLDYGMAQVDKTVSSIGARMNTIDTLTAENESLSLVNSTTQSSIRDTDMAAAASKLILQQTMLEAAQAAFAKVSQLSLFDAI
jgi:flagellar hook-associated protein 3 FlgL